MHCNIFLDQKKIIIPMRREKISKSKKSTSNGVTIYVNRTNTKLESEIKFETHVLASRKLCCHQQINYFLINCCFK